MIFSLPLRALYTELAVGVLCVSVAEQLARHAVNAFQRATHLHLTFGCSRGAGVLAVILLVGTQAAAAAALLLPKFYLVLGAVAPSAILSGAVWTDALLFEDLFGDRVVLIKCIVFSATAALIALFRFDRRARNAQLMVPTSSSMLAVERSMQRACTALRTASYCPVVAAVLIFWCTFCNNFWWRQRFDREYHRSRWHISLAMAALFLLQAAQDTRHPRLWALREWAERKRRRYWPSSDRLLGNGMGRKKLI